MNLRRLVAGLVAIPCAAVGAQDSARAVIHDSLGVPAGGQFVEYYWKAPAIGRPAPVIVFIHGHQDGSPTPGGKAFVDYGVLDSVTAQGYVAVSVSQPGYGHSAGPADFMGPRTVAAVRAVIDHFRAQPFVQRDRIGLEGVSRGAIVASLVAAADTGIRAMVLISGAYDFVTPLDSTTAAGRRNIARRAIVRDDIARETDGSQGALRTRSALLQAKKIRAATLLLNGQDDDRTDPAQARLLAQRITANGVYAHAITYPGLGHAIPYELREREIRPFFRKYLAFAKLVRDGVTGRRRRSDGAQEVQALASPARIGPAGTSCLRCASTRTLRPSSEWAPSRIMSPDSAKTTKSGALAPAA